MQGKQLRYAWETIQVYPEYTFGGQIQITLAINADYKIVSTFKTTVYNDLKTDKKDNDIIEVFTCSAI